MSLKGVGRRGNCYFSSIGKSSARVCKNYRIEQRFFHFNSQEDVFLTRKDRDIQKLAGMLKKGVCSHDKGL